MPWSAPPHDRLMSRKWFCLAKWQKTNGKQSDTPRFVKGYLAYLENAQISIVKLKIINVTGLPNKGCITWSKIYHLTKLSTWTATGAIAALRPSGPTLRSALTVQRQPGAQACGWDWMERIPNWNPEYLWIFATCGLQCGENISTQKDWLIRL